jgi:hypothetical protein
MDNSKSTGQVTGQNFHYAPALLPLTWATRPSEVPSFDWIRKVVSPYATLPKGISKNERKRTLEAVKKAAKNYHCGLPRLVRANYDFFEPPVFEGKIYLEIAKLHKVGDSELPGAIVNTAQHIGLLDPHGTGDSLHHWKLAAKEVGFWLKLLRFIRENPYSSNEALGSYWSGVFEAFGYKPEDGKEETFYIHDREVFRWLLKARDASVRRFLVADSDGTLRRNLAKILMEQFITASQGHTHLVTDPFTFNLRTIVRIGALGFARYELAQLFYSNTTRECKADDCSHQFEPIPRGTQYCSDQCKERTNRRNYRAKLKTKMRV